jgi:hypothetical protein
MAPVLAFMAVGAVTALAVVLIVVALVIYLVAVIVQLRKITGGLDEVIAHVSEIVQKSAPVNDVVTAINEQLDAGRSFPESAKVKASRIGEVYTRGTLTLARLGREAPIARGNPAGFPLRNVEGGSLAARQLYPELRQSRPESLPRSPVIGTDSPVQYEQREDIGAPRKRLPRRG